MTTTSPRPPRARRRSGVVVPHGLKWHGEVAAALIWLFGKTLHSTLRLEVKDDTGFMAENFDQGIAAIWHNRLAVAMPIWRFWQRKVPDARLAGLISASRDGALLSRTFSYFGVKPIRGSSSRHGAQALLELTSAIRDNFNVAITPDGPRGPKYHVQPGIISLAQVTGAPIVPLGAHIQRKIELRSWDRFQIPLPFTKCRATLGRPIWVPRNASAEELEQMRLN